MFNPFIDQIQELEQRINQTKQLLQDQEMAGLAQSELADLTTQLSQLQTASAQYESGVAGGNQTEPTSVIETNATFEFRQGTGGDEAKLWAGELMRMYCRFIESTSFRLSYVDDLVIQVKGKSLIKTSENDAGIMLTPFDFFRFESGVHRVQRVPVTESSGRIHTSTATVAVLPEVPKAVIEIREEDLDWQFMRAGGAGGQSVNKTNSAVRLTHLPSGIVVSCRTERSQAQNREIARELLRARLWEQAEARQASSLDQARSAIGSAARAEKIRTYNFPQNRVTDHRTKQSWYNLSEIVEGSVGSLVMSVRTALLDPEFKPGEKPEIDD